MLLSRSRLVTFRNHLAGNLLADRWIYILHLIKVVDRRLLWLNLAQPGSAAGCAIHPVSSRTAR